MAHPALLLWRHPLEQPAASVAETEAGPAELAGGSLLDPAAELVDHQLHPVTDAEHRDPQLQQLLLEGWRPLRVDRGGAAGEDEATGGALPDSLDLRVVREQLAEDAALPDPPCNQLAVLAAEV